MRTWRTWWATSNRVGASRRGATLPTPRRTDPESSRRVIGAGRWFDGRRLINSPIRLEIAGDRIVRIGGAELEEPTAEVDLFGDDAILCPGFIDSHSHSDFAIADDPRAVGAVMQGITTQVVGQCGFSAAPLVSAPKRGPEVIGDDPTSLATSRVPTWETFDEYRTELQARQPAVNVVPFVGHNTLIRASHDGDPEKVVRLAHDAAEGGARGISTGLSYQLGRQTTDADVAMLLSAAEHYELPYHTHMRYSDEETALTLESTLKLAAGRCRQVTVSHVFPRFRDTTTTAAGLLSVIERWAPEFDSLTFDVTVYESGGTPWTHGLPEWASSTVSSRLQETTRDSAWKDRVVAYLADSRPGWETDWPHLVITKVNRRENRHVLGRTVAELASEAGLSPAEYAVDLVVDDGHFWVSPPNKRWSDLVQLLSSERCIPMVDGITVDPTDPGCLVALERGWNAFRRFLNRTVPEGSLSLETALRKLTSDAATRLDLEDRGVVSVGAFADLTIVNPENLAELEPPDYTVWGKGIEGVMVNGRWVLDPQQSFTGDRPGAVL